MDFLKENKNIIIIIGLIVIAYLLFQTNFFRTVKRDLMVYWYTMSNAMKLVILLVIIAIAYYCWE